MSSAGQAGGSRRNHPAWPDVDVVMPIRNEAPDLEEAVASVRAQRYPGRVRIILAVAPSTDGTEEVAAQLAAEAHDLTVVPNPAGITPVALNLAIRAGSAPVLVRVDGHSVLCDGYIEHAVSTLQATGAGNVGGRQVPQPETPFEEAVAAATTSRLGTGGASYRVGGEPGPVDTVYLGVFDRSAIEAVGLFDEHLIRNQDYELNIRLRKAGFTVWFDPDLWVGYRPRSTWRALARQYFEYGQWKAEVLRLHPDSLKLRQLAVPVGVSAVIVGAAAATKNKAAAVVPLAYLLALAGATLDHDRSRWRRSASTLAVLHWSWAAGLLDGAIKRAAR